MSKLKFTPGPWRSAPYFPQEWLNNGQKEQGYEVTYGEDKEVVSERIYTKEDAALIAAAPEMYESNALCLDETCVMQVAFTFACAKCEISKDTKCEDCPISAGMRAMFRQRDRMAKLQKKARGEE